ncbi:MAG TPA: hypothetical protein VIX40_03700, partial [Methylomirabilota bacterium]
ARLGYGLFTYKTVRSTARLAYPAPNLLFCRLGDPAVAEAKAPRKVDAATVTWATSFGLPSAAPEVWRADVKRARAKLAADQLLIVSVVGTPQPGGDADGARQAPAEQRHRRPDDPLARTRRQLGRMGRVPGERPVRAIVDQAPSSTLAGLQRSRGVIEPKSGSKPTP